MLNNERMERFCLEYVNNAGNGARAAVSAGYAEGTARQHASWLLKRADIRGRIAELRADAVQAAGFSKESALPVMLRNLWAVFATPFLDVVRVSAAGDDDRGEVMDAVAEHSGGQRIFDFGEPYVVLRRDLTDDQRAAVESVKHNYSSKGAYLGDEVKMKDALAAMKLFAQLAGFTGADVEANVTVNLSDALEAADRRVAEGRTQDEADGRGV